MFDAEISMHITVYSFSIFRRNTGHCCNHNICQPPIRRCHNSLQRLHLQSLLQVSRYHLTISVVKLESVKLRKIFHCNDHQHFLVYPVFVNSYFCMRSVECGHSLTFRSYWSLINFFIHVPLMTYAWSCRMKGGSFR